MAAKFIELPLPGGQRMFLRLSIINRIITPPHLDPHDIASPNHPIEVHTNDGATVLTFGISAFQILFPMFNEEGAFCDMREGGANG